MILHALYLTIIVIIIIIIITTIITFIHICDWPDVAVTVLEMSLETVCCFFNSCLETVTDCRCEVEASSSAGRSVWSPGSRRHQAI